MLRFTFLTGVNTNHIESVEAPPITLGRDDTCQVRFDKFAELAVSGQHARIDEVSEGTFEITNLSKNGILVNGVPCDGTSKLPNHSTIQLGKDGPRVRFDVDTNVGGISKTDVQRKTQKLRRGEVERGTKPPTTEERPVFVIQDVEKPKAPPVNPVIIIAGVIGLIVTIAGVLFLALR